MGSSYTYIKTTQIISLTYLCIAITIMWIVGALFVLLKHPEKTINRC